MDDHWEMYYTGCSENDKVFQSITPSEKTKYCDSLECTFPHYIVGWGDAKDPTQTDIETVLVTQVASDSGRPRPAKRPLQDDLAIPALRTNDSAGTESRFPAAVIQTLDQRLSMYDLELLLPKHRQLDLEGSFNLELRLAKHRRMDVEETSELELPLPKHRRLAPDRDHSLRFTMPMCLKRLAYDWDFVLKKRHCPGLLREFN